MTNNYRVVRARAQTGDDLLGRLLHSSVGLIAEETLEFGRCLGAL
jgi:hypothetical protein